MRENFERIRQRDREHRIGNALAALQGENPQAALEQLYRLNPDLAMQMEDQLYQRGERQRTSTARNAMSALLGGGNALNSTLQAPDPTHTVANPVGADPITTPSPAPADPLAPLPDPTTAQGQSAMPAEKKREWEKYIGQVAQWADTPGKWDQAVDWFTQNGFPAAARFKGRFSQEARAGLMRQAGPSDAERELINADPEAYLTFQGKRLDVTGKQLKNLVDLNNAAMQILGGVHDQVTYDAAKQQAVQLYSSVGHDASSFIGGLPPEYSPETIKMLQLQGMDTSKQLAAIARENNIESQIEVREQRADEYARHNRAMEGNTRRGQDVRSRDTRRGQDKTDKRLRETGGRKAGANRGDLIGPVYQKNGKRIQFSKKAGGYVDVATGAPVN